MWSNISSTTDLPVILVGLVENPPLVPKCVAESIKVADIPSNCDGKRLGWPAEVLLLLHRALGKDFELVVSRLELRRGEGFSALIRRGFAEGSMDLNGVPMSWTPERAALGGRILPLPALWHPYEFLVSKALILTTTQPIVANTVELLPFLLFVFTALFLVALNLLLSSKTLSLSTLGRDLLFLLGHLVNQFQWRGDFRRPLHAAWNLAAFLTILEFDVRLKTTLLRKEVPPFTTSQELAARIHSREVRFAVEASESRSSFFQKVADGSSDGQRALREAFRANPLFVTESTAATKALLNGGDPNFVFKYRKSYEPVPRSHYRQEDKGSGSIMSQYFLRENPRCSLRPDCPTRRTLKLFEEGFLAFVADHSATLMAVYNHDNIIRVDAERSLVSDFQPISLDMLSALRERCGQFALCAASAIALEFLACLFSKCFRLC